MKNLKIKSLVFVLLIVFMSSAVYGAFSSDGKGTTGATFLKIPRGVRATGMGGAYAGVSDDAESVFWNPAGLNKIDSMEISAMHSMWFESIYYNYLNFVRPFEFGKAGFSLNYLGMDDIDKYTIDGVAADSAYSPYNLEAIGSYGREIDGHMVGVNLKIIHQSIDDETSTGAGLDLGYLRDINNNLTLGGAVQNIGPGVKFRNETDPLPLNIKTGASYKDLVDGLVLAMDLNFPVDNIPNLRMGTEYSRYFTEEFKGMARLGFKTSLIEDLEAISGLSAGMGISYSGITVNYTWDPYGKLNSAHRFALSYNFGTLSAPEKKLSSEELEQSKRDYFSEGHQLFADENYQKSIEKFKKVLELDPDHSYSLDYIERAEKRLK